MAATRRAEVTWNGELLTGHGVVTAVSSGAFTELPVSWAARTEGPAGKTSPEELVAAAETARDGCPISQALKGNVALSVDAALED